MPGRRCLGRLGHRLVLRGTDAVLETLFTTIEQAVDYFDLFGRQREVTVPLPESALLQHPVNLSHRLLQASQQGFEELLKPVSDIQGGFLARLQSLVVPRAVLQDAGRHCIKTDGLMFALGQCQVSDSACQAAIAIVQWVQRDKPKVRYTRAY